jgi:hypothetical protein
MRLLFIAFCLVVLTSACTARYVKVANQETIARYFEQVTLYNKLVDQIKASLDIKAYGILGSLIHEQADVIVKSPQYLYWSLRSFFGVPSVVLASNGEWLTMYDFSGHSPQTYQKIALKHDSFFELLDFRFHPQSLIDILLGRIPLGKNVSMSIADDKLEIKSDLDHGWSQRSIFDPQHNRLLETFLGNELLSVSYHAKYDNFTTEGMSFPRSIVLLAKGKTRFLRLHIEYVNVEINGDPVLPDIFYLESH